MQFKPQVGDMVERHLWKAYPPAAASAEEIAAEEAKERERVRASCSQRPATKCRRWYCML